jgi:hypothetical protein
MLYGDWQFELPGESGLEGPVIPAGEDLFANGYPFFPKRMWHGFQSLKRAER